MSTMPGITVLPVAFDLFCAGGNVDFSPRPDSDDAVVLDENIAALDYPPLCGLVPFIVIIRALRIAICPWPKGRGAVR